MTPTDHETEEWVLLPRDPDEAMIVAVDRTGCLDAAQNGSVADAVREVYRAAISAAPAPPSLPAGAADPVAWRVKDFADGWILFHVEALARHEADETGALIQPLYADVLRNPAKSNTSAEPVKTAGSAEEPTGPKIVAHSFDQVACQRKRCRWPECVCPALAAARQGATIRLEYGSVEAAERAFEGLHPAAEGVKLDRPVKMLVDAEWLSRKVEADPDLDAEAGSPAPTQMGEGQ